MDPSASAKAMRNRFGALYDDSLPGYCRDHGAGTAAAQSRGWLQRVRDSEACAAPADQAGARERRCVEGYLDRASAAPGDEVAIHASARHAATLTLRVYRDGAPRAPSAAGG